jgi:hypothetical protein
VNGVIVLIGAEPIDSATADVLGNAGYDVSVATVGASRCSAHERCGGANYASSERETAKA